MTLYSEIERYNPSIFHPERHGEWKERMRNYYTQRNVSELLALLKESIGIADIEETMEIILATLTKIENIPILEAEKRP